MNEDIGLNWEMILSLIVSMVGTAWIAFKGSEAYQDFKETRYYALLEKLKRIIDGAVLETEVEFVRGVKAESKTGRMNEGQAEAAYKAAERRVKAQAPKEGIDPEKLLGGPLALRAEIEKTVSRVTKPGPPQEWFEKKIGTETFDSGMPLAEVSGNFGSVKFK